MPRSIEQFDSSGLIVFYNIFDLCNIEGTVEHVPLLKSIRLFTNVPKVSEPQLKK